MPVHPVTYDQTLDVIDHLVDVGKPTYFVTANLNTVMLAQKYQQLRNAACDAAFVVADGFPLVKASAWKGIKLPERVTGSDLIYGLSERAALKGHRLFLLGGLEGVADKAAEKLKALYPALQIVGTCAPPIDMQNTQAKNDLIATIRSARPDLLFVALGQPKGEIWIHQNYKALGVPVSVQVGASIDFVAGRVRRAPRWVQRIHMETPYRILQEPKRLAPRYTANAIFLARMLLHDMGNTLLGRGTGKKT